MLSPARARALRAALLATCAAALAVVALALPAVSSAASPFGPLAGSSSLAGSAPTCDNSWKTATSGDWFTAANWTAGHVPTSTENTCIKVAGTYTVTDGNSGGTATVKSLQVGGTSGTQTLAIAADCSHNVTLTTTNGTTIGTHGVVTLTSNGCGNTSILASPVTNNGTLTSDTTNGGTRRLEGNVTNNGTINVNQTLNYDAAGTTLDNAGTVNVATGMQLTVSGASTTFTNDTGGTVAAAGSGQVFLTNSSAIFNQGAGTTTGTEPVLLDDATLHYTGSGSSLIYMHGTGGALTGSLASGQTLDLESTCSENTTTTAGASFTSAGTIDLTSNGCGNIATLVISSGTLTSTGTITSDPVNGGTRKIEGNLTNSGGTINVNLPIQYDAAGATLDNAGTINLADTESLNVTGAGGTFTNDTGGQIVATGSGQVFLANNATVFNQGAGTTSGAEPVLLDDATLNYTGTGSSLIYQHGTGSALSGNLASGQVLDLESTCGENTTSTAGASFTNAGTIKLTTNGCGTASNLTISTGTLTNTGTITSDPANGGTRKIEGNLTNSGGTINVNQPIQYDAAGATLDNAGTINLADTETLNVTGTGGTFTNDTGGQIVATGSGQVFVGNNATVFNQGAGTTSGTEPVLLDDTTLNYTGTGSSLIYQHGTGSALSGNLAHSQVLDLESTCSENTTSTAGASFTNAGTIKLTTNGCGTTSNLTISSGTLTNASNGTIISDPANGGSRFVQGNVNNSGTIDVNQQLQDTVSGATFTQTAGTISIANGMALSLPAAPTFNDNGGTIAGGTGGQLQQTGGTWNQGLGKSTGAKPILLDNSAIHYLDKGATLLTVHGTGTTVSGNLGATGQTLAIENTCSEHSVVMAAASFTSMGKIEFGSAGCGNESFLTLPAGGVLTNKGTVMTYEANGNNQLQGTVVSPKIVATTAGDSLRITGDFTESSTSTFKPGVGSSTGVLNVNGTATLAGTLAIVRTKTYKPGAGTVVNVLNAASVTGTFATVTGAAVNPTGGTYFVPQYTPTAVNLVVEKATLTATPTSGPAGTTVTVSGTNWPANANVTIAFIDKAKVKTTLTTVAADGTGAFSTPVTVPAGAALGKGKFTATSAYSAFAMSVPFTVTS